MVEIDDASRLRELCEKASKEYDHEKLIDLVRQINELLERKKRKPGDGGSKTAAQAAIAMLMGSATPGWAEV